MRRVRTELDGADQGVSRWEQVGTDFVRGRSMYLSGAFKSCGVDNEIFRLCVFDVNGSDPAMKACRVQVIRVIQEQSDIRGGVCASLARAKIGEEVGAGCANDPIMALETNRK